MSKARRIVVDFQKLEMVSDVRDQKHENAFWNFPLKSRASQDCRSISNLIVASLSSRHRAVEVIAWARQPAVPPFKPDPTKSPEVRNWRSLDESFPSGSISLLVSPSQWIIKYVTYHSKGEDGPFWQYNGPDKDSLINLGVLIPEERRSMFSNETNWSKERQWWIEKET